MRRKRSRFALLGILALAFIVTAGLTISDAASAQKKKKGGGGTKTISKAGGPIPDGTALAAPTGNGGPPDFHRGVLNSVIKVGRKFASAKIKDVNVQVSITHQDIGDLQLFLYGPNGQSTVLSAFNDNNPPPGPPPPFFSLGLFGPTTFDDQATLFINDTNSCPAADPDPPTNAPGPGCTGEPDGGGLEARPPYAGSFKPEDGTLAGLGSRLFGNWILTVVDGDPFVPGLTPADTPDTGTLTNWKLIAQLKGGGKKKK
jgi:hypothetical protein